MHILPSLKTFRLFLIALLAVALTGGIAFFNSSPATAATPLPSVSMEVVAAQSGLGTVASGSPVYLTGQGLNKGTPFTFVLDSDSCEHVTGSSSLKISDGATSVSLFLPDFSSASGCSITATLTAEIDPALWPVCDATHVITATVQTVMETTADGKVSESSTTSGVDCGPVVEDPDCPDVSMGPVTALEMRVVSTFGDLDTSSVTTGSFDCPTDSAGLALPCNNVINNYDRECGTDTGGFPVSSERCGGFNNNTTWIAPEGLFQQAKAVIANHNNITNTNEINKKFNAWTASLGSIFSVLFNIK